MKIIKSNLSLILFVLSMIGIIDYVSTASKDCPLASKMINCTPKCKDDSECFGQRCCPNICNTKSCAAANQLGSSAQNGYKGSLSGGTGVYCGNVKCNSFEKCEMDRSTKRMKCVRA